VVSVIRSKKQLIPDCSHVRMFAYIYTQTGGAMTLDSAVDAGDWVGLILHADVSLLQAAGSVSSEGY